MKIEIPKVRIREKFYRGGDIGYLRGPIRGSEGWYAIEFSDSRIGMTYRKEEFVFLSPLEQLAEAAE